MSNWQLEYKTITIDKTNVSGFLLLPGVRGKCCPADKKIVVYRYKISPVLYGLSLDVVDKVKARILKLQKSEPVFIPHEKHHSKNADSVGDALDVLALSKNIYEYLGLRCMEEASAFVAGDILCVPNGQNRILKAAVMGTDEFLHKYDLYMNIYTNHLYSSVVCFNLEKPTNKMVRENGMRVFEESYSKDFHNALSAYFTFGNYQFLNDKSIKNTPEYAQFRANVQKIKSIVKTRADTIKNSVLFAGCRY